MKEIKCKTHYVFICLIQFQNEEKLIYGLRVQNNGYASEVGQQAGRMRLKGAEVGFWTVSNITFLKLYVSYMEIFILKSIELYIFLFISYNSTKIF